MSVAVPDSASASNEHVPSVKIKDSPVVSSACPVSSQPQDDSIIITPPENGKICSYFRKTGTCRFGVNCKFRHEDAPLNDNNQKLGDSSQKICYSFVKHGHCRFGERCKFFHSAKKEEAQANHEGSDESEVYTQDDATEPKDELPASVIESADELVKKDTETHSSASKQIRPKICRYYKRGSCKRGSSCTYAHPEDKNRDLKGNNGDAKRSPNNGSLPVSGEKVQEERKTKAKPAQPRPKFQIQTFLKLSELTEEDLKRLRQTETHQLKQRFPDLLEMENDGQPSIYRIVVHPTDPDWPFDLRDFELNVCLPFGYPAEPPIIDLPEDQDVPAVILRYITYSVQEWIQAKHEMNTMAGRVELIVRPFLRWFDRNLESKFTEGARKFKREVDVERAGFQFISNVKESSNEKQRPTQPTLPENAVVISRSKGEESTDSDRGQESKLPLHWSETGQSPVEDVEDREDEDDEGPMSGKADSTTSSKAKSIVYDPPDRDLRGTEVLFQGLKMTESVASLGVVKMTVIVQCSRCKESTDLTTPPRRNNLILCGRCNNRQIITYRPCLVHPLSHVIGFLDLDGCLPFDVNLVTSTLTVGCLACSHDNVLKGIQHGQARHLWCEKCHQKMTVQADSCRFQRLQPAENIGSGPLFTVPAKGPKKQPKDPVIVDMLPLPENGTCKHYKKSFRWLRFPCCGKFYPCDECHDIDNAGDHDMKYATRMLCGFCAKEQPYSADKPCVRCGSSTTKARTKHWEGGTGCRSKVRMSRNDKQKYAGTNKTVSKKAQQKAEPSKKGKS